jgi:hypothetical protein
MTDKYAYRDWEVEKQGVDRDGNPKKRMYYEDCPATTNGVPTPGRRHRADKERGNTLLLQASSFAGLES